MPALVPPSALTHLGAALKTPALEQPLRALCCAALAASAAHVSPVIALLVLAFLTARVILSLRTPTEHGLAEASAAYLVALVVGLIAGLGASIGVLFTWRLFADARWSVRELHRLAIVAGKPDETRMSASAPIWLTAALSLSLVAYSAPHAVLGAPLELPHAPIWLPIVVGIATVFALGDWALRRAVDGRLGHFALAPAAHVLTYHAVFLASFGIAYDLSAGIVAVGAWRLAHAAPGPLIARDVLAALKSVAQRRSGSTRV